MARMAACPKSCAATHHQLWKLWVWSSMSACVVGSSQHAGNRAHQQHCFASHAQPSRSWLKTPQDARSQSTSRAHSQHSALTVLTRLMRLWPSSSSCAESAVSPCMMVCTCAKVPYSYRCEAAS